MTNSQDSGSERINPRDANDAGIARSVAHEESVHVHGTYHFQCFDKDGNLKWEDDCPNVVTTVGGNDLLDKYLAGSAYTASWFLGLISATSYTTGPAAGDTAASHAGWAEDQNYSQATRVAPTWNAAASKSKASNAASFSINASTTIKGSFLIANNTKGGTTGILYSAGLFTGGDKVVANGDTLNVTYTASV